MARKKQSGLYHCGMCTDTFTSKDKYNLHTKNHQENGPATLTCEICKWPFDDSLAFETHKINTGHGTLGYYCEKCGSEFATPRGLDDHMRPPGCRKAFAAVSTSQASLSVHHPAPHDTPTTSGSDTWCGRCRKTFRTQREYDYHRSYIANTACTDHNYRSPPKSRASYVDPDKPKDVENRFLGDNDSPDEPYNSDSDTPTNMSCGKSWCSHCKTVFASMAQYNAHFLRCSTKNGPLVAPRGSTPSVASGVSNSTQTPLSHTKPQPPKAQVLAPKRSQQRLQEQPTRPAVRETQTPRPPPTTPAHSKGTFTCNYKGCQKVSKSEAGLKVHKQDAHGVGGTAINLLGKDARMVHQRVREQSRQESLLRPPPSGLSRGGRGPKGQRPSQPTAPVRPAARTSQAPQNASRTRTSVPSLALPPQVAPPVPTGLDMGGVYEIEQANDIQGKILRLLIQSDIFIHNDGKMTVCGINWIRIGVEKQPDVSGMFDGMCHLPKSLQGEYLPPPKAFAGEYQAQYPVSDFMPPPPHDRSKPGLSIVVIACSKIVLQNGRQEVVKVAAVDLITCRIFMNHLVCTDAKAPVQNWRSKETGLFEWADMEHARKLGYKVFRGWQAVRSALFKVIDTETIIVGHNLRSDLDCLRIEHGRAVDVAKVAEKMAKGPLSKAQLALDSLCRDYATVNLRTDPDYGRDVLMNAFAIREMGLWVIKNREKFEKDIRQKSRDYELVMPRTVGGG